MLKGINPLLTLELLKIMIVLTGEQQPFGNFILRKGVIGETLRP